jgi:hypothetical protein
MGDEQIKAVSQLAKIEGQSDDIFYGSSLALQGVFVEVIRSRFRGENLTPDLPYYWAADPTPGSDETNEGGHPRKLYIESEYLEFPDAKNYRPAILIDAGESGGNRDVVANRAGAHRPTGIEGGYFRDTHAMEVLLIDETRGGCSILSDIVRMHLLACRMLIREAFRIHEMTEPRKSKVVPYRRDKDLWECQLSFQVEVELRWTTRPIAPVLREIAANFRNIGDGDLSKGALSMALYNGAPPPIKNKP